MTKKIKKICFVIPRTYYLFNQDIKNIADKVGGAQKQGYLISIKLAENKKFEIHFCVADFGQKKKETHNNITVWKSFNFNDFIIKRIIVFFKTLMKINANIYVFRAADVGVTFATLFIKFFLKKKIFYMLAHNTETNFKDLKKMSGFLAAITMPFTYKYADILTTQSQEQYDLFAKFRKRKPDAIIKNIIPVKNQIIKTENYILWVGRLDKIKKPEMFLKLAEKFTNEKFVMIAPVVRDFIGYGNKIKKEAKAIKNLKYIDFVKPEEIENFYLNTKIYVITSDSEGFSNTMAEAMATKCPVLSYKVNPDNILKNAGFCANGNIEKFYTSFKKLLENKKLRNKFGTNGYNYIKENHRTNIIIEKIIKLL